MNFYVQLVFGFLFNLDDSLQNSVIYSYGSYYKLINYIQNIIQIEGFILNIYIGD